MKFSYSLARLKHISLHLPLKRTLRSWSQTDEPLLSKGHSVSKFKPSLCSLLLLWLNLDITAFKMWGRRIALTALRAKAGCAGQAASSGPVCAAFPRTEALPSTPGAPHVTNVTQSRQPRALSRAKFTVSFPGIQHNADMATHWKFPKAYKFSFPFIFLFPQRPKMTLLFSSVLNSLIILFFFPLWTGKRGSRGRCNEKWSRLPSIFELIVKNIKSAEQLMD